MTVCDATRVTAKIAPKAAAGKTKSASLAACMGFMLQESTP